MYYSPDQPPPTLFDQSSSPQCKLRASGRTSWKLIAGIASISLVIGLGAVSIIKTQADTVARHVSKTQTTPTPTPQVAGVSFGDILKSKMSYPGWLAGVQDGKVVLLHPDSGSVSILVTAKNGWFGPISDISWSPDRTKLAYIIISPNIVESVAHNPSAYGQQNGFGDLPDPSTFPFGQLVIVDVATKQMTQTNIEVRNTNRSFAWLDDQHIAGVAQSISIYSLADGSTSGLSAVGSTNPDELIQSPLVWQDNSQTLFYTKVRRGSEQSVKLLMSVRRDTNQVTEVTPLKTGSFEEVTNIASADMALSDDGERLAVVSQDGLAYMTLDDSGLHPLPYKDEWVWLKNTSMSDLIWLSPAKLAFSTLTLEGSRVWGVWDIPSTRLYTFGKDSQGGSWDISSSKLVLIQPDGQHLGFLTPNWDDPTASVLKTLPLAWDAVSW